MICAVLVNPARVPRCNVGVSVLDDDVLTLSLTMTAKQWALLCSFVAMRYVRGADLRAARVLEDDGLVRLTEHRSRDGRSYERYSIHITELGTLVREAKPAVKAAVQTLTAPTAPAPTEMTPEQMVNSLASIEHQCCMARNAIMAATKVGKLVVPARAAARSTSSTSTVLTSA